MKMKLILFLFVLSFSSKVRAQDPIFTQYFLVPETLNPGFTGFLETTTAGILHRTQWPNLNFRIDTDFGFVSTWLDNVNSGIGLSILNQREKFTDYNFSQLNLNYAYRVQLTDRWFFRPAIEIGFGNKSYGFQNLLLEDQINIDSPTINTVSADPLVFNSRLNFFDVSAGMLFNTEKAWFGMSLKHLNKPNVSFAAEGNLPLDFFFSANAGYEFPLTDYINMKYLPYETKMLLTTNFMKQGQYSRLDLGAALVFNQFFFGVGAATNPMKKAENSSLLTSINAFGGLQYGHFKFGYSYDFNTSTIRNTGGVYELSILYQFNLKVKCLGCPNYY